MRLPARPCDARLQYSVALARRGIAALRHCDAAMVDASVGQWASLTMRVWLPHVQQAHNLPPGMPYAAAEDARRCVLPPRPRPPRAVAVAPARVGAGLNPWWRGWRRVVAADVAKGGGRL